MIQWRRNVRLFAALAAAIAAFATAGGRAESAKQEEQSMKATPSAAAPRKVKVAAIRVVWGNKEPGDAVIARGLKLAADAAEAGAQYILLPEDFLHGGAPESAAIPDGAKVRVLVEFAREHGVFVVAGIDEFEKGANRERPDTWEKFITAVFVSPDGVLSKHRKVNINIEHMAPGWKPGRPKTDGDAWPGFDYKMHAIGAIERSGIMICRDSFTNYAWTRVLSQDPQIIFHP
ncbi:MAG: hypothetical protein M1457_04970, partial [bacterium]|nr:hypothetical protein [bacterium]